jgi:hypothetical protein
MGVEPLLLFLLGAEGEWVERGRVTKAKGGGWKEFLLLLGIAPGVFGRGYYLGSIPPLSPPLSVILIGQINYFVKNVTSSSLFRPTIVVTYLVIILLRFRWSLIIQSVLLMNVSSLEDYYLIIIYYYLRLLRFLIQSHFYLFHIYMYACHCERF